MPLPAISRVPQPAADLRPAKAMAEVRVRTKREFAIVVRSEQSGPKMIIEWYFLFRPPGTRADDRERPEYDFSAGRTSAL